VSRLQRSFVPAGPPQRRVPPDVRRMNAAAGVLTTVFVLLALSGGALWLVRLPLFNLSAIRIDGDVGRNSAATLRANVMSRLHGNFFTVDMAQTRAAFEAVPWVRKAAVQREFPNRLKVVLQEHKPVARWGVEGDPYLVNTFGEVFEVNQGDVDAQDLPLLTGPNGQALLLLQGYQMLSPVFEPLDMVLEALELTSQGSWRAQLDSGAVVNMGHGSLSDIQQRTRQFINTFTQVSSRYGRALESADLRYSAGYAIKLRGVTTVTAAELKDKKAKR
jgi:cell division protein FtsQ